MTVVVSLKNRSEFLSARRLGFGSVSKSLVLQAKEDPVISETKVRLGFTVTKKVGNAVVRNRIKRRLRAVSREIIKDYANPKYYYVIIGRKACLRRSFNDLKKDLKYCLHDSNTYLKG